MDRLCRAWMLFGLVSLTSAGCCCVQGVAPCGDCGLGPATYGPATYGPATCDSGSCDSGSCESGFCGSGPLLGFLGCRGACGEVYVDEWVSEPPCVDNCGYDCGGCGNCRECQPIRNVLRLLWGTPYRTCCNPGICGPACDGGCASCDSGGHAGGSCNCGGQHMSAPQQMLPPGNSIVPQPIPNAAPMEVVPEQISVPTRAPQVSTSSARRLNPAQRRRDVQQASYRGLRSTQGPASQGPASHGPASQGPASR